MKDKLVLVTGASVGIGEAIALAMALFLAGPGARNVTGEADNVEGGLVPS